jgi:hypothetical protein
MTFRKVALKCLQVLSLLPSNLNCRKIIAAGAAQRDNGLAVASCLKKDLSPSDIGSLGSLALLDGIISSVDPPPLPG